LPKDDTFHLIPLSHLRDRLDELSLTTTYTLNLASRCALLDLLQRYESGKLLPALDQLYFQTMLAVMDPETRRRKGRTEAGEVKRVELRNFLDGLPAYVDLAPHLSFSNAKFLANRVAEQLATATRNGVVFRLWSLQRGILRCRLRLHLRRHRLTLNGKQLERLLNDLQLFLRNPGNFREEGDYGYGAPYGFVNNLIQKEFRRYPLDQLPKTSLSRRTLKTTWSLFVPYLIGLCEEVNFLHLWEEQRKEIEKLYPDLKTTPSLQPPKRFSPLPVFSYSRKCVKLEPEAWKAIVRHQGYPVSGEFFFLSFFFCFFFFFSFFTRV